MLNFTHSKRNANSNYPEIPYLLIRLTKQVEQTLNNSIGNDTFLYTGYMMHRGNLTTVFKIIHAHCPLIQQLHFQELIHKYIHTCLQYIQAYSSQHDVHYSKRFEWGCSKWAYILQFKKNMEQQVQCMTIYIKGEYLY